MYTDTVNFEEIGEEHLDAVLDIYNHYVLNTTATFHAHAFGRDEFRELVFFDNPRYRTYVIKEAGAVCGYVLLTQHKKREAYDGTAEVTVYLVPGSVGKGFGSRALQFIEQIAKERGIHVLVATICGENARSIGLFERNGYDKCAHYREVGQKFGQRLDVVAYQKIIG
ncbi:N-acetyltransferase family protein [Methanocella sp. MCL-LM]|uniref:GNAT family N-acetyltransferase n=1 Tax=Methanocella sp. MCL-LM TaxID=3412035 RepID=UPI003C707AAF